MSPIFNILLRSDDRSLLTFIPSEQLAPQSLQIIKPEKQFKEWSEQNHADSYSFMQRIAQTWKSDNVTDQYLIYGKIDENPFNWEVVPYQKCRTCIGRIIQQLQILWRIVFGGISVSAESRRKQYENFSLENSYETTPLESPKKSDDSFCKADTIDRQWVITGQKVNVLFNYAPIGFGGERLHFLVVPKEHREAFTDVTQEEYCESMELTTKLLDHFTENRKTIKNAYLLNKTGKDAGQTVKHWHLHVIFSTNAAQDFWGKLTVLKNILLGSSPMKKEDLAERVSQLREELTYLQ